MSNKVEGRIAVIGAGVAGVATATALNAAGLDFVVYERNPGVGGLWFQNYPGASGTLLARSAQLCSLCA
jgi:cation diffusion facilitator CzcD-associated flavoprotein CzcO